MSQGSLAKINQEYNQNYFTYAEDISRCPRAGCDYAGFFKRGACRSNMSWEKCNFEWKDFSQLTIWEKASKSVKDAFKFNSDTHNYLNEIVWSNACPGWGITIYKVDGCSHMVWQKCKYEFCWIWLGHYPGYVHQNDTICGVRKFVTTIMIMMWIFSVASHIMYTDLWIAWFVRWFWRTVGKFALANIAGLSIFLTFPISFGFVSWMNSYSYSWCDTVWRFFTGCLVIFYPMGWGFLMYFSYHSTTFYFIPMYIIYEIIIVIGLIIIGIVLFLLVMFWYYWAGPLASAIFRAAFFVGSKTLGMFWRKYKAN